MLSVRPAASPDVNVQCLGFMIWLMMEVSESGLVLKVLSGFGCFSLGALHFGPHLPRASGTTSSDCGGSEGVRLRVYDLGRGVCSLKLVMLHAAQLSRGGPGAQRPLLVSLAEGVRTELAESR